MGQETTDFVALKNNKICEFIRASLTSKWQIFYSNSSQNHEQFLQEFRCIQYLSARIYTGIIVNLTVYTVLNIQFDLFSWVYGTHENI